LEVLIDVEIQATDLRSVQEFETIVAGYDEIIEFRRAAFNAARQRAMGLIQGGDPADLNEAIRTYEWLRAGAPRDTSIQAILAAELCLALRLRFAHTQDPADLDAVAARGREAERGGCGGYFIINLVAALTVRSEITGNVRDLREALRLSEAGLASLSPDDAAYPQMLANYGVAVRVQAELASDPSQLDEAISRHERIRTAQQGDLRALTVLNLGSLLRIRYQHTGEPADLTLAIEYYREAASLTQPGGRYFAEKRNDLGVALRERFEIFRDAADVAEAVAVTRLAGGDRPTGKQLLNLGGALDARGELLNDPAARDEAVEVYRAALAAIEPRHAVRPSIQINLAPNHHRPSTRPTPTWPKRSGSVRRPYARADSSIRCSSACWPSRCGAGPTW
jgi:tetratricopeptide (TPR) repeat protein